MSAHKRTTAADVTEKQHEQVMKNLDKMEGEVDTVFAQVSGMTLQSESRAKQIQVLKQSMNILQRNAATSSEGLNNLVVVLDDLKQNTLTARSSLKKISSSLTNLEQESKDILASLLNIVKNLDWMQSILQVSWPETTIKSKFDMLISISQSVDTASIRQNLYDTTSSKTGITTLSSTSIPFMVKRLIRSILDENRGVIPALNTIHKVLMGNVNVDPYQQSLLVAWKDRITTQLTKELENPFSAIEDAVSAYFTSMVLLQSQGLILLLNAYSVLGDNDQYIKWAKIIPERINEQSKLVGREKMLSIMCLAGQTTWMTYNENSQSHTREVTLKPNKENWKVTYDNNAVLDKLQVDNHHFSYIDQNNVWVGDAGEFLFPPTVSQEFMKRYTADTETLQGACVFRMPLLMALTPLSNAWTSVPLSEVRGDYDESCKFRLYFQIGVEEYKNLPIEISGLIINEGKNSSSENQNLLPLMGYSSTVFKTGEYVVTEGFSSIFKLKPGGKISKYIQIRTTSKLLANLYFLQLEVWKPDISNNIVYNFADSIAKDSSENWNCFHKRPLFVRDLQPLTYSNITEYEQTDTNNDTTYNHKFVLYTNKLFCTEEKIAADDLIMCRLAVVFSDDIEADKTIFVTLSSEALILRFSISSSSSVASSSYRNFVLTEMRELPQEFLSTPVSFSIEPLPENSVMIISFVEVEFFVKRPELPKLNTLLCKIPFYGLFGDVQKSFSNSITPESLPIKMLKWPTDLSITSLDKIKVKFEGMYNIYNGKSAKPQVIIQERDVPQLYTLSTMYNSIPFQNQITNMQVRCEDAGELGFTTLEIWNN